MDTIDILIIALALAMDAAAVSLGAASAGYAGNKRAVFRLAFHFGLFQALMPLLGYFLGISFVSYVQAFAHWIAFALLLFVGGRMLISGMDKTGETLKKDPSKGMTMVVLSIAVSLDAMAVGVSFAMMEVRIWMPVLVIGLVTSAVSWLAIMIGRRLGDLFGKSMEIVGGLVLVGIGIRIVLA
ncbi:manganese efflux pump MntP family protein [Desulfospira joergensenii]|uniref:manganese efflux pump MntP n=1 Tax=Desulfospira joergensenii TaxID=53329 RepID=UPI0003B3C524|nr:manganese efflux pump MntP family protein [Desulfospira joergensenii]